MTLVLGKYGLYDGIQMARALSRSSTGSEGVLVMMHSVNLSTAPLGCQRISSDGALEMRNRKSGVLPSACSEMNFCDFSGSAAKHSSSTEMASLRRNEVAAVWRELCRVWHISLSLVEPAILKASLSCALRMPQYVSSGMLVASRGGQPWRVAIWERR